MMLDDEIDALTLKRILDERALALAQIEKTSDGQTRQGYVILAIGKEKYGVLIQAVQEIRPIAQITRVPNTPSFYLGLVNLRGRLYPALDVQRYLNLPASAASPRAKLVLVAASNIEMGLHVDEVLAIEWIADAEIQPLIDETSRQGQFVRGTTPSLVSIIDLDRLLSDPQLIIQDSIL